MASNHFFPQRGWVPFKRARSGGGGGGTSIMRGYLPSADNGTAGNLFVDQATGSDANPGTVGSPKLTISGAMSAASAGQVIRVKAGTYRETVSFAGKGGSAGDRTTVARYGTDVVKVTAANAITGWTQCGAGDSTVLGAVLGVVSSPVYKKTIAKSTIASSNPRAAFPFENGVKLNAVMARSPNPLYPESEGVTEEWLTATTTVTSAGLITGYRLASLTSLYTTAQIQNADVVFYGVPNLNYRTKVASFGAGTDAVGNTINLTDQTRTYAATANKDKFALINILPALKAGEWGFTDDDATNCTLYIYPNNPANMTANIEYSARGNVIDFGTNNSHCEVSGLIVERASGSETSPTAGGYGINGGGVTARAGLQVNNCLVRDTYRSARDYAPIWLGLVDDWRITQTSIQNAYGQFGFFVQGGDWNGAGMASGGRADRLSIENVENSPARLYGQTNTVISWLSARRCGVAAHSNKGTSYQDCHRVLWWGCDYRGCSGYEAWQQASSIAHAFCDIPVSYLGADGRAANDQNYFDGGTTGLLYSPATEQGINGDSYFINCVTEPFRDAMAQTNSLTTGKSGETAVLYTGKNNILHGAATVDQTRLMTNGWRNNLLTSGSALAASAGTDATALPSAVYNDTTFGDTSIKAGSPSLSAATASIAADIAVLAGWFPDFASQMGYDLAGAAFNSATPPMGPYVNALAPLNLATTWIERPTVSGIAISGNVMSLTGGYRVGYPFPALTYQWVKSTDLVTWTNISGATSATYTLTGSEVGSYIGCNITSGGVTVLSYSASLVASSWVGPSDPVLLTLNKQTSGSAVTNNRETATFTANNKPLIVVCSQYSSAASDSTLTVTVGTPARGYGTGTALTQKALSRRNQIESQVFYIAAPGSGSVSVQVQSSLTSFGAQVAVFEVDLATDVTAPTAAIGATNGLSAALTVTTDTANSLALHVLTRQSGVISTNAITFTGATELSNDNSGGTSTSSDISVVIGFERVSSPGVTPASASWPTAATYTGRSVQIKP